MRHIVLILLLVAAGSGVRAQHRIAVRERPVKILAIGNSFSTDALEYLDDLARAAGVRLVVGNLYIGGCSLERHWNNAKGDLPRYEYRKNDEGRFTSAKETTLLQGLLDEEWDVVTFQQASPFSGQPESYFPYLTELVGYVKAHLRNKDALLALHQTWAYAADSKHDGFANYGRDQRTMYGAIVAAMKNAAVETGIAVIIPSGTAVQNGRSALGDRLCRDGYHLDLGIGRYTAACAWFEMLLGPVSGNTFRPRGVSAADAAVAQCAARIAVAMPGWATDMRAAD